MGYTKEQAEEVLRDYNKFHDLYGCEDVKEQDDDFINHKFPQLPNTGVVVGGGRDIIMRTGEKSGYGFVSTSEGFQYVSLDSFTFGSKPEHWRPATEKQSKDMLIMLFGEAKDRYLKHKNQLVRMMGLFVCKSIEFVGEGDGFRGGENIKIKARTKDSVAYKEICVFDNGDWLDLKLKEVTMQEIADKFGVDVNNLKIKK